MKTAVVRARIPKELKENFEAAAATNEMNLSQALRVLMVQYVECEREIARKHEETLEALEDIEAGDIIDGDKVISWLAGWGTEDELDPPQ